MDPTASDLFERYHVAAYRYFLRSTGAHDVAEDLTQELFLRILRYLKTYRVHREGAWVFRIARNVLADHRHHYPARDVSLTDAPALQADATQLLAFSLSEALALISEQDREVFVLREVTGFSYAEIAGICDTTTENVRARMCRARARLRGVLGPRLAADENRRRNEEA